ncbi:MAG: luxQ 2 [Acidobacteria bacterium]|nr:luxQ 2 [Acidobacteriota bacterium]
MPEALTILHLEDNQHDADLVDATLSADGLVATIVRVDSRPDFENALASGGFDVILADYNLPSFDGRSAQVMAAAVRPDIPFIFLSGSIGEELAVDRLKEGATDYVLKDRMARLPSAVRRALAESAERADRLRAEADVRRLNAELERRVVERTAELAESQRRLQAILDYSPAAIALKDLSGRYIVANSEFDNLAGGGAAGKCDEDLFPPRLVDVYRANDARALEQERGLEFEETYIRGGAPYIYHAIKFPLLDSEQRPYAVCAIAIDVTERKKTDDALRMARLEAERANRAKSAFLSNMSHDLRTPLNAILGFAQLLDLDDRPDDRKESVAQILRGGTHLLSLINEVLDIARIEAGHLSLSMEPVHALEMVELATELVQPLAAQRGITFVIDRAAAADVVVLADRQRLNQVLLNLLSNAVKYNRPNGTVTIGVEMIGAGRVRLTVTDTGAGIAEAKRRLLFQPFERLGAEQTAIEGTGLGLALSRGLAEAMGGELGVDSVVDHGSTFWIELALTSAAQAMARTERPGAAPAAAQDTRGVVLYIEDNRSNVRLMERILERRTGVRLVHAGDGELGVRAAATERPDLIFLDLHLPDMSGEDVLHRLWQDSALRGIPVAILSADATVEQARRLKASGAVAYLTKPLQIRDVLQLIDERLNHD